MIQSYLDNLANVAIFFINLVEATELSEGKYLVLYVNLILEEVLL